jgi:trehalose 6-phosphate phosphatase
MTAPPLARVGSVSATPKANGAVAVFLDVDGTLLDFAQRPDSVITPPGLVSALAAAERRLGGALALVSGRPLAELDQIFAPLRLRASGVHGAQMRFEPGGSVSKLAAAEPLPLSLWERVLGVMSLFPGTIAENKAFSYAIHYRLAPWSEGPLREAIQAIVDEEKPDSIEIMDAHFALELKRPGADKGQAIRSFLSTPVFSGRTPIFLGDDTTDQSGFAYVSSVGGFGFAVTEMRPGAVGVFEGPSAVRDWISGFGGGEAE